MALMRPPALQQQRRICQEPVGYGALPGQPFLQSQDPANMGTLQRRYWRQICYRNALQRGSRPSLSSPTFGSLMTKCSQMMSSPLFYNYRVWSHIPKNLHTTPKYSPVFLFPQSLKTSNERQKFQAVLNLLDSLEALMIRKTFLNFTPF